MKELTDIIIEPVISEQSTVLAEENKYVFVVRKSANKIEIKHAIEKLFDVAVKKVNVLNVIGKTKRVRYKIGKKADWKKALVSLMPGETIEYV